MNPSIRLNKTTSLFCMVVLLAFFGLAPLAQAVVPAPDGGYPNFTTAEGTKALFSLTTGAGNTAAGWFSLQSVTTGNLNTGVGAGTLVLNTADKNTATGAGALLSNTTGENNTANGTFALFSNTTGRSNTAIGSGALYSNMAGGNENTANGFQALFSNTGGGGNAANGFQALFNNTNGILNTANGYRALYSNTSGRQHGQSVMLRSLEQHHRRRQHSLGRSERAAASLRPITLSYRRWRSEREQQLLYRQHFWGNRLGWNGGVHQCSRKLGTTTSSRRLKKEIKPMDKASEAIHALKPVTFRYKKGIDPQGIPQFGLVAEDVEKVNPDLVVRDNEGKPYSVRYDQVNAMLLNEFLKEHRKVQEQESAITQLTKDFRATAAQQQKEIQALTATLKEQAEQIQR